LSLIISIVISCQIEILKCIIFTTNFVEYQHIVLYCWHTLQAKISKRGRKLIDYDVARHNFETMSAKKVDQVKLSKVGLLFYLYNRNDECKWMYWPVPVTKSFNWGCYQWHTDAVFMLRLAVLLHFIVLLLELFSKKVKTTQDIATTSSYVSL